MKVVGYARVSTIEQKLDRQIDILKENNIDLLYCEKMTGTKKERPELERMIKELNKGDIVLICDLTRISRSTRDLLDIIERIKNKGAFIRSIKDQWLNTTEENPYNNFLLSVMGGLSQLERDLTSERTKEGLKAAKSRGRTGGRPNKQNEKKDIVIALYNQNVKIVDIVKNTSLSRSTVNRIIKAYKERGINK